MTGKNMASLSMDECILLWFSGEERRLLSEDQLSRLHERVAPTIAKLLDYGPRVSETVVEGFRKTMADLDAKAVAKGRCYAVSEEGSYGGRKRRTAIVEGVFADDGIKRRTAIVEGASADTSDYLDSFCSLPAREVAGKIIAAFNKVYQRQTN